MRNIRNSLSECLPTYTRDAGELRCIAQSANRLLNLDIHRKKKHRLLSEQADLHSLSSIDEQNKQPKLEQHSLNSHYSVYSVQGKSMKKIKIWRQRFFSLYLFYHPKWGFSMKVDIVLFDSLVYVIFCFVIVENLAYFCLI